jgi:hypothetical protein
LGQLLDDPYAAVRCVAARSLQAISGLTPPGYDFVEEPRSRAPMREEVWRSWQKQWQAEGVSNPPVRSLLVWPADLNAQRTAFDEWLRLRDPRPVRLRE